MIFIIDPGQLIRAVRVFAGSARGGEGALTQGPVQPSYGRMNKSRFKPTPILRERRHNKCARFALIDSRGEEIAVMVRDISSKGLSAAALGTPPALNEVVRAQLEDGRELWGLVRWSEGNLFGVEFDTRV
ncbi:PilZ domain-containing protein [Novosphingobium sp. CF614]|uniref:PilZ domain-containing protein n=1 Tax=Novosphingobium sp. CF614 TaxID=1884364 RepID=UPI0008EB195A|nr:PilZ domain-containing protein [Novosphingobium sp. CF614]SFF90769.1 PilZ domain-containing protein [Novosphingobium sp. CF614]